MKDKFERFVRDNRDSFDTLEPSDALWSKISFGISEQKLPQKQLKKAAIAHPHEWAFEKNRLPKINTSFVSKIKWQLVAASVVLLLGVGYWLNNEYQFSENPTIALTSPSLAREVSDYSQIIENKQLELRKFAKSNPDLYKDFATEMADLNASYEKLKTDLKQNPNQEMLIRAMIENLQWQVELLNQQLNIINKIKQTNETRKQSLV